jgi:hypothetical protein
MILQKLAKTLFLQKSSPKPQAQPRGGKGDVYICGSFLKSDEKLASERRKVEREGGRSGGRVGSKHGGGKASRLEARKAGSA